MPELADDPENRVPEVIIEAFFLTSHAYEEFHQTNLRTERMHPSRLTHHIFRSLDRNAGVEGMMGQFVTPRLWALGEAVNHLMDEPAGKIQPCSLPGSELPKLYRSDTLKAIDPAIRKMAFSAVQNLHQGSMPIRHHELQTKKFPSYHHFSSVKYWMENQLSRVALIPAEWRSRMNAMWPVKELHSKPPPITRIPGYLSNLKFAENSTRAAAGVGGTVFGPYPLTGTLQLTPADAQALVNALTK